MRRADKKTVREYQPFTKGETRAGHHVLTVLQELSNADKHRTIQPVIAFPAGIDFIGSQATDCIVRRVGEAPGFDGRLEPGAELARFYVKKTGPNPRVIGKPHFTFVPAINQRLTLMDFLSRTEAATERLLREFADPPGSALALISAAVIRGHP